MSQLRIENHNSVTLLNRLRIATHATTSRERRGIFNGLRDALKGLGLIEAKGRVEGIYEGVDAAGNHWFMVDTGEEEALPSPERCRDPKCPRANGPAHYHKRAGVQPGITGTTTISEIELAGEICRWLHQEAKEQGDPTSITSLYSINQVTGMLRQWTERTAITSRFYNEVKNDEERRTTGSDGEPLVHPQAAEESPKG